MAAVELDQQPPADPPADDAGAGGNVIRCKVCQEPFALLDGESAGQRLGRLRTHRKEAHPDAPTTASQIRSGSTRRRRAKRGPKADETAPRTPDDELASAEPERKGWRGRLWGAGAGDARTPAPAKRGRPAKVKRTSTAGLFSAVWGGLGTALVMSQADAPVGRAMQYQAGVVGDTLDKLTAGTPVDAFIQPFAANADAARDLGAVLALPFLVGAYERVPIEARPMLEPMLVAVMRQHLTAMVPLMKKQKAEESKWAETVAELGLMEGVPEGADPVEVMILAMFGEQAPPPAPEPGEPWQ